MRVQKRSEMCDPEEPTPPKELRQGDVCRGRVTGALFMVHKRPPDHESWVHCLVISAQTSDYVVGGIQEIPESNLEGPLNVSLVLEDE